MKKGKSELVLVVDRSGSMSSIKRDMEGALTEFIKNQKSLEGHDIRITYYKFDTEIEKEFENQSLNKVTKITIEPRGGTALLDALATAIDEVGARLSKIPEDDRPESVQVIVITDGEENSSRKFNQKDVFAKIKLQEQNYSWLFTYLGANQDAIKVGASMGFSAGNSIIYAANAASVGSTTDVLTLYSSGMRYMQTGNMYGCFTVSDAYIGFDDVQRRSVNIK